MDETQMRWIAEGAEPYLEDGEAVLAAFLARSHGRDAKLAFALTPHRLLVLGLGGGGQKVTRQVTAFPVEDVTSLEVEPLEPGHRIKLEVDGRVILLRGESDGDVHDVREALETAQAA